MYKKILFYDTTWNQLLRVGNVIAKELQRENLKTYGLVYETSENEVDINNDKHYFTKAFVTKNISEIREAIQVIKPDVVVFAQNTIPDLYAILYSQQINAKIIMLQHGLLYDGATLNNFRVGEVFAALLKVKKSISYLNILRLMCSEKNKSFLLAMFTMIRKKYNITTTIQNYFNPPLRGNNAFVIGEHWIQYYHDNYGYPINNIFVMGNHDVDDIDLNKTIEDAICYIPSVHVEDGKVTKRVFDQFLSSLKASLPKGKKFYIKLHPRSDKNLYLPFFNSDEAVYVEGPELPYVKAYIGHNSSLLSKALQISGVLILWGFKEEPELFYKDFAFAVCNDMYSLKKAIKSIDYESDNRELKCIEKYSYHNPMGAYKYCANKILEIMDLEEV